MTFSNKGGGGVHILDSDGKMFPKKNCLHFFSFTMGHDFKIDIFYLNKDDNYISFTRYIFP